MASLVLSPMVELLYLLKFNLYPS
uniref:Uncharacterized protein n=1 Tax=Rhizophora mucronata TaxID=61149 RepID=A0A2P2P8R8_RHIMU